MTILGTDYNFSGKVPMVMDNINEDVKKKDRLVSATELEDENGAPVFNLTNAATAMECTGLIQVPPESEEELESYLQVYSFKQPHPLPSKDDSRNPAKNNVVPKGK